MWNKWKHYLKFYKLNKSKSTEDIPEKTKDQGVIDCSDDKVLEARNSLIELIKEGERKHSEDLN